MNMEIKFRGKTKNDKWVFGYYHKDKDGTYILTEFDVFEVLPETVGQFTGLHDKNGKEIYEGDLIQQTNFNGEQYEALYEVVYDAPDFCLKMLKGNKKAMEDSGLSAFALFQSDNKKLPKGVVIGNIQDNTELLKNN